MHRDRAETVMLWIERLIVEGDQNKWLDLAKEGWISDIMIDMMVGHHVYIILFVCLCFYLYDIVIYIYTSLYVVPKK